ncbi:MAG: acyl-CoA dehydrogenase family protein [Planctomycetota bacterium]
MNEDHQQIREVVASFSDNELWPGAPAIDKDQRFPTAALAQLAELGVLGIPVSSEHGGADGDLLMLTLVLEELARGCAATSVVVATHAAAALAIRQTGSAEQQAMYLSGVASGDTVATLVLAQVRSGGKGSEAPCLATPDGDDWLLDGSAKFVIGASEAGLYVVFARTPEARGGDCHAFAIAGGASHPGVRIERVEDMLGLRGGRFAEVVFDGCRIPGSAVLGAGRPVNEALSTVVAGTRIAAAAIATGVARRAIDYARQYAGERRAFGKSIDRFEAIRNLFADAVTGTEAGALLAYRAAYLADQKQSFDAEASMAKLYCTEAAYRTTKSCVQILGGNGFSREYPVERMYRDAESLEVLEAQASVQRRVIAARLLEGIS